MSRAGLSIALASLLTTPFVHASDPPGDDQSVGLRATWTAPLGPAYSRVAIADDLAATQYADGESDWVVALDAESGTVRWKFRMGPMYLGHDGSEDGPISTPVVGRDTVFALDPRGKLVALDAASGELRWSKGLVEDLGATEPDYGFTSTPWLEGGVLVVQAGGSDGRNLCGLDAATGDVRWSTGAGRAGYQSPVVHELAGRRQLIVLNGDELQGVAPFDGEVLWTHALPEGRGASSGSAGVIDGERFFLLAGGQLAVFRLSRAADGFEVELLYQSRELGNTYARPVHHGGYLYGFKSTFLTCVDAQTGERVWKSRPPGGRGLALAGDHLIVYGAEGIVAVVRATPEGYFEEGRAQALDHSGYAWPTVANGRVFVRNSKGVACLELVSNDRAASAMATTEDVAGDHAFGAFVRSLAEASDPAARIDAFLAEQDSFPILEGDLVHFVYRGEADDVAVSGSMTGGAAEAMARVPGTDFYHRTYRIVPGARWEYTFQVDYGDRIVDPRNPRTVPGDYAPVSEVVTPGYAAPDRSPEPGGPRGRLESYEFTSEKLGNTRTLNVYLPAGYDEGGEPLPVVLLHDGTDWLEKGAMQDTLDDLIGESVRPLVVVFVTPMDRWWFEAGGSQTEAYVDMLATELLPDVARRFRISRDPADVALAGVRGFGLTAALGVVAHPDVFGKAAVQSPALADVARHALFERLAADPPEGAVFFVGWNRYEPVDLDRGEDFASYGPLLHDSLERAGCVVRGGEVLDAHGWSGWRAHASDWLVALFPLE